MRHAFWLGGLAALLVGCDGATPPTKPIERPPPTPRDTLAVGDVMPKLVAGGWLNGEPKSYDAPGVRGTVVDVWAMWCPVCAQTAPDLMATHEHFRPKGVEFVGISSDQENPAKSYLDRTKMPWPNGHTAELEMLAALGSYQSSRNFPGADGVPTLYLVGPDGKVRWTDARARFRHQKPAAIVAGLETAIKALLDEKSPPRAGILGLE